MNTENLSTLKIHKLTQEQYERELNAGRIDPSAMYLTPEDDSLFLVNIDVNNNICSHSASEIIDAVNSGKTVINNYGLKYAGYSSNPYVALFIREDLGRYGDFTQSHVTVMEDKSITVEDSYDSRAIHLIHMYNGVASHTPDEIAEMFYRGGYRGPCIIKLLDDSTGAIFDFAGYSSDNTVMFCSDLNDGHTKFTTAIIIDENKNCTALTNVEAIVPAPSSSDAGKVLVAGNNQVSWESTETFVDKEYFDEMIGDEPVADQINNALENFSSGKTLTEHLTEEDMILSSRQYGDTLPPAGTKGRVFFLREVN